MRTKTRTTEQLKPGMVIKSVAFDSNDNLLDHAHRVVATNTKTTPWAERRITFTDGTYLMTALGWEHEVARGKTARNAAKARAAMIPGFALAETFRIFGAYATA